MKPISCLGLIIFLASGFWVKAQEPILRLGTKLDDVRQEAHVNNISYFLLHDYQNNYSLYAFDEKKERPAHIMDIDDLWKHHLNGVYLRTTPNKLYLMYSSNDSCVVFQEIDGLQKGDSSKFFGRIMKSDNYAVQSGNSKLYFGAIDWMADKGYLHSFSPNGQTKFETIAQLNIKHTLYGAPLGNDFIFSAKKDENGETLWKASGTSTSVQKIADIGFLGDGMFHQGKLYFSGKLTKLAPCVTDGTTSGTHIINKTLNGGSGASADFVPLKKGVLLLTDTAGTGNDNFYYLDNTGKLTLILKGYDYDFNRAPSVQQLDDDKIVFKVTHKGNDLLLSSKLDGSGTSVLDTVGLNMQGLTSDGKGKVYYGERQPSDSVDILMIDVKNSLRKKFVKSVDRAGEHLGLDSNLLTISVMYWSNQHLYLHGYFHYTNWSLIQVVDKAYKGTLSVYNDLNKNGQQDQGEYALNTIDIEIDGGTLQEVQTGESGKVNFALPKGKHTISVLVPQYWVATTDSVFEVKLPQQQSQLDLKVGVYASTIKKTLEGSVVMNRTRCGFNTVNWISVENSGTVALDGEFILNLDTLIGLDSFEIAATQSNSHSATWELGTILPRTRKRFKFYTTMPGTQHMGSTLKIDYTVNGYENNSKVFSEQDSLDNELTCSYDPNDKQVSPDRMGDANPTLFTEKLRYTIRFQNTGTDTAFTVKVVDTLSPHLDWSSFNLRSTSHPVVVERYDDGRIAFVFENILLPDSHVNEPESHGFIHFDIESKSGLQENTVIENTAYIYFDFNPAIVTNTTLNTMVSNLPVSTNHLSSDASFNLFPNPANHLLYVVSPNTNQVGSITLRDQSGKVLSVQTFKGSNQTPVRVHELPTGFYFVEIATPNHVQVEKLVKN